MNRIGWVILELVVVLLLAGCRGTSSRQGEQQYKVVRCASVVVLERECGSSFPFISEPYQMVNLSFRVGGPIEELDVQVGRFFRNGERIASIDDRDYRVRLTRAEAHYEQMKAEFARIESLYAMNNVAATVFEKARYDRAAAHAAYLTAQNELDDTQLVAPFDGYIQEVYAEQFQDVRASERVVSLIDVDRLKIKVYVPLSVAMQARTSKSVLLTMDTDPHRRYKATIIDVSHSTTANNLSYLVTALLGNDDGELLSGMSGKATFVSSQAVADSSLCIPHTAVRERPSVGSYVWVVNMNNKKVEVRKIELGSMRSDGLIEVHSGLSEGECIATTGLEYLHQGEEVDAQNDSAGHRIKTVIK